MWKRIVLEAHCAIILKWVNRDNKTPKVVNIFNKSHAKKLKIVLGF